MNPIKALTEYIRSSIAELKKVTWPSRQETLRYTLVVSAVSLIVAGFFASLDFGLSKLVDATLVDQAQSIPAPIHATPIVPELETSGGDVQINTEDSQEFFPLEVGTEGDADVNVEPAPETQP